MTILAQAKQYQVEFANLRQLPRIVGSRRVRAKLSRDPVDLPGWDGHMIEPCGKCHAAVAFGVLGGQTALVAEIDLPCRPIGIGAA